MPASTHPVSPLVSVIMPVYNGARFLEPAIRSILDQTLQNFELLICDDGSTDESLPIAHRFAGMDHRIRVLALPHEGFAATLNSGVAAAGSPLLARMDADDIALPERLEKQLDFLSKRPEVVAVGTSAAVIDSEGRRSGEWDVPTDHKSIDKDHINGWAVNFIHPTITMRREALIEAGGYSTGEEARYVEDIHLWLRLAERGELANLGERLLDYRVLEDSYSHSRKAETARAFTRIAMTARERRGLPLRNLKPPIWAPPSPPSAFDLLLEKGRQARRSGDLPGVLTIACRLLSRRPWSKRAWSLLAPARGIASKNPNQPLP